MTIILQGATASMLPTDNGTKSQEEVLPTDRPVESSGETNKSTPKKPS